MTIDILEDAKASDITCINIKNKSAFADYMIIATCTSSRHIGAVSDYVNFKLKEKSIKCRQPEGGKSGNWTLIDINEVVVHLFKKETRLHYNLEKLWDINFDSLEKKEVI